MWAVVLVRAMVVVLTMSELLNPFSSVQRAPNLFVGLYEPL